MTNRNELLQGLIKGDSRSLARSITVVENELSGYEQLLESLDIRDIPVIGVTGPPGAGKSTLVNELIKHYLLQGKRIGILAVDPSSPFNFGALLGDRIRMPELFNNEHVFIRSIASRGSLGGLSEKIIEIIDLMKAFPFDMLFVETVGVGQSEVEIAGIADQTVVVLVPESGDQVQVMKAGLMEIADVFVLNKSERPDADTFFTHLLHLIQSRNVGDNEVPVLKTQASQGVGVDALANELDRLVKQPNAQEKRSILLATKMYRIIQKQRMKDVSIPQLIKVIALQNLSQLNIYRFLKDYLPA
jgi:LAO/AO transport system kinase